MSDHIAGADKMVSLAPLLERLKRTDAPTVEEVKAWDWWNNNGGAESESHIIRLTTDGDGISINGEDMFDPDDWGGEWRPVPTVAELLALAALPLKVAEVAQQKTWARTSDLRIVAGLRNEHYDRAVVDALNVISAEDPAAIVEECAK